MEREGLAFIVHRNLFYRDKYRRVRFAVFLALFIDLLLIAGIAYNWTHPTPPRYFATTADGKIIPLSPLSKPVVSDDYVIQWTANQVRATFSVDYIHWREQLQRAAGSFTISGWRYFLTSLKRSNNLKTLIALKMVSSASITGSPQILEKAIINGHFAWKIQMPILVTYVNGGRTIPMPMDVTVIVLRMPVKDYPFHIAINNFLPVIRDPDGRIAQGAI